MRSNTIGFLVLVTAIATFSAPASAQFHANPIPSITRVPLPGVGTSIPVARACNRPLERRGRMINAFIQSYDSTSGVLTVSTMAGLTAVGSMAQPVFQASTCLPIESHDGRRQTLSALVPEKFVVIWVSDILMPTEPPQFILMGIEVYDSVPTAR